MSARSIVESVLNSSGERVENPERITAFNPAFDPRIGSKMWLDRSGRFFNADCGHADWASYLKRIDWDDRRSHLLVDELRDQGWVDVEVNGGVIYVRHNWSRMTPAQRRAMMRLSDEKGRPINADDAGGPGGVVYPDPPGALSEAAFAPSGRTMRLGDLPRDMREDLFNMHSVSVDPEATEARFYAKRVPLGVLSLEGVVVSRMRDGDVAPYVAADPRRLPPLVVADGKLLDGQHRILAARKLGVPSLPAIDVSGLVDTSPESMGYVSVLP